MSMSNTAVDLLIFLFIIACTAAIFTALFYGIVRLVHKIHNCNAERRFEEDMLAIMIYRSVCQRVNGLPSVENYSAAMKKAISEIDINNISLDETAEKIAEALVEIQQSVMAI